MADLVGESPAIRIATRASRLALWQAKHVADLLRQTAPDRRVELVEIATTGDRDRIRPLHELGPFGVFTREVQKAVLDGRADLAVHSLKDLPTEPTEGLALASVPSRASMFDALVLPAGAPHAEGIDSLPRAARVGTGSVRRQAQLLHRRDDLRMLDVRGNVETRLKKLDGGEYDALVLAEAGLRRLGLEDRISMALRPPLLYPAVGQGALGVECRADDADLRALLARLTDAPSQAAVTAERTVLAELRAGCHAPLGVLTTYEVDEEEGRLMLEAVVLSHDGRQRIVASATGPARDADSLGRRVAADLQQQGADRLVEESRGDG